MRTLRIEKPCRIIWACDNGLCQWIEFERDGELVRARMLRMCVYLNQPSPDPRYRSSLPNVFSHCEWHGYIAHKRDELVVAMGTDRNLVAIELCKQLAQIITSVAL